MSRILQTLALAASTLAPLTASLATFSPITSGPSYTIGIPSSSSISTTSNGPIYIEIRAPATYTWVGFGIGSQMLGARIFVLYQDGNGNVTLSARDGRQHVMPEWDQALQSGVEILNGTGIRGGQGGNRNEEEMVARFRLTSSTLLTSKDDPESPFIAAWMQGSPLNNPSPEATIRQHSTNAYRQFTFDLREASISSENPFQNAPVTSDPNSSNGNQNSGSGGGSGSGATVVGTSADTMATYQKAHGIIMSLAVVLFFPLGAIAMRLGAGIWIHGIIQLLGTVFLIAGFGLGVKLGDIRNILYKQTHTICGTVLFALFLLQPLGGLLHHQQYLKTSSRSPISYGHIWLGRILIILGIINGGLGLRLAANTTGGKIAYGVVAGVVGVTYILAIGLKRKGGGSRSAVVDGVGTGSGSERGNKRWGRKEKGEVRNDVSS